MLAFFSMPRIKPILTNLALATLFLALSACSSSVKTASGPSARDVFYHDTSGHAATSGNSATASGATSVAYRLELRRGESEPVSCDNRFAFKSGDALRLHIKVNEPLYCYVLTSGSTGEKSVLYPPSGENNLLQPDTDCVVPANGEMIFDDNAGTDRLLVALTTKPIAEDKALTLQGVTVEGSALTGSPTKVGDYSVISGFGSNYELGNPISGDG